MSEQEFDKKAVVALLNEILETELAGVVRYPHYSLTTTKGALERARAAVEKFAPAASLSELGSWPTHPLFVRAHAELIQKAIAGFPDPRPESVHLLYSAHSIPKKLVTKEGDPYASEIEASVRAIHERAGALMRESELRRLLDEYEGRTR